jgi:hypothetical protein
MSLLNYGYYAIEIIHEKKGPYPALSLNKSFVKVSKYNLKKDQNAI